MPTKLTVEQRLIRALCWVPVAGMLAEAWHTVRWGNYQSDPDHSLRWYSSVLLHILGFCGVMAAVWYLALAKP